MKKDIEGEIKKIKAQKTVFMKDIEGEIKKIKIERYAFMREKIIGYVLFEYPFSDDHAVYSKPIILGYEEDDVISSIIGSSAKIIGVLPAHQDAYAVSGILDDDSYEYLGYEHGGKSYCSDWEQELATRRVLDRNRLEIREREREEEKK